MWRAIGGFMGVFLLVIVLLFLHRHKPVEPVSTPTLPYMQAPPDPGTFPKAEVAPVPRRFEYIETLSIENAKAVWVGSVYQKDSFDRMMGELQIVGGWGDYYESFWWFKMPEGLPKGKVIKVALRVVIVQKMENGERIPFAPVEVRAVTYTCPVAPKGQDADPDMWSPHDLTYAMRPSSKAIGSFTPTRDRGTADIDLTEWYRAVVSGKEKNRGIAFAPLENGNQFTHLYGPMAQSEENHPKLVITLEAEEGDDKQPAPDVKESVVKEDVF